MKRTRKNKIRQDTKLIRLFRNQSTYILILLALLIYLFQEDKILNMPLYLRLIHFFISLGIIALIFVFRFKRYPQFYISEIRKLIFGDKAILLLGIALLVYVFQSILSVPLNFVIKKYSGENSLEYYDCKITNVNKSGIDKIHFIFLGRKYFRYFNVNGYTRSDLINNYNIELSVRESLFNTYYIESMNLKKVESLP